MRRLVKDPVAYRYEHADGLKCTMLLMNGLVRDFNFAAYRGRLAHALVHADVPAHARRPHHAGQFLQPAGEPHGEDVPDRQAHLSRGADAAHHRADRGRRGEPVPRAGALSKRRTWPSATSRPRNRRTGGPNHADTPHISSDHRGRGRGRGGSAEPAQAHRHHRHHLPAALARAAHGRPLPGRLSLRRRVAQAGHEGGLALRGPEARGRPERRRAPRNSASRSIRPSPRRCAAAATNWRWTRC